MVLFIKEYLKNTEKIKKRKQVHINSASKTSPFLTIRWISSHRSITVVQSLSRVWFFVTPWTIALQASLSFTISWSLLKLRSIESVMPCNHLALCCPLLLLPSIFPSIRVFPNESVLQIRWPKYSSFSFSFSINPSSEYSGLISFRMDWLDLLAVQGTLKSLFQHHSLKASILLIENIKTFDYKDLCWQSNVSAF